MSGSPGGFPRGERLRRREEFQAVFRRGKRVEQPSLIALWRKRDGARQVGFTVSRQVRGAVCRNRARRRLREAYLMNRQGLPSGIQLVCVAREAAVTASFEAIDRDMKEAITIVARQFRATASP